jgi:hypothetical protein
MLDVKTERSLQDGRARLASEGVFELSGQIVT